MSDQVTALRLAERATKAEARIRQLEAEIEAAESEHDDQETCIREQQREIDTWRKRAEAAEAGYLLVADALMPTSLGPEHLATEARRLRAELATEREIREHLRLAGLDMGARLDELAAEVKYLRGMVCDDGHRIKHGTCERCGQTAAALGVE